LSIACLSALETLLKTSDRETATARQLGGSAIGGVCMTRRRVGRDSGVTSHATSAYKPTSSDIETRLRVPKEKWTEFSELLFFLDIICSILTYKLI
jgi:hypothetical protein